MTRRTIAPLTGVWLAVSVAAGCDRGADSQPAGDSSRTRVVLLGTGTPVADPERWGPAVAVVVDDAAYLVDCGPGVVRRAAAAAREQGIDALVARNLERVFITHLHSDHTVGCPDLLLSPWVLERSEPLRVWGPAGAAAMFDHIVEAFRRDIDIRIHGLEPRDSTGYRAVVQEIEPGVVYEDDRVRVTAFRVEHGSWRDAFGYRFDTPDRSIVISGDARPSRSVVERCDGCDVLIHEVYSAERFGGRAPEWQRYHSRFHTSTEELARLASEARPGLLVLYHQLYWGATDDELLAEVRRLYDGPVVSGADLDVY